MTQAVAVRRDGDAFQARIFWRKAACLLDPASPVAMVGFESGPKGFDDVWVAYAPDRAPGDHEGKPILREHIQCKWHVSINDFGYVDLIDPEWINANKFSLLQRARRCAFVLDLIPHFDERVIHDQAAWATTLYPMLKSFLQTAAKDNQHLRLILDAHITLAFAAGSVLNIKSGRSVEIEQRTVHRSVWHSNDIPRDPSWPGWAFELETLNGNGGDMAVAVCLTHDVVQAVKSHLAVSSPEVSSLLIARPTCGAGARSVVCGQHAFDLAEALALQINERRIGHRPPLHLFIAAPNAFTFFLGQRQPGLGKTTLYEYDFEGANGGGYKPSLSLPI